MGRVLGDEWLVSYALRIGAAVTSVTAEVELASVKFHGRATCWSADMIDQTLFPDDFSTEACVWRLNTLVLILYSFLRDIPRSLRTDPAEIERFSGELSKEKSMRRRWIVYLGSAMLAGALGGTLLGPSPVGAVAREIVDLQQSVSQLIQGQRDIQTTLAQNAAVDKALIEQSVDTVNKLTGTMMMMQKTVQDMRAASGARLDTMSTELEGISDNLQEALARMGKLNQLLTDEHNAIEGIDAKLSASLPLSAPTAGTPSVAAAPIPGAQGNAVSVPRGTASSANLLYSNGVRDVNGKKYDLASLEFTDYLKYYGTTDLASDAQFYLGEIFFAQQQYDRAIEAYNKVMENYPKSLKLASAHLKKGLALISLGEKSSGVSELLLVLKTYPGTDEERLAKAKLQEMGIS
jgi:tol-pal system protein YbgF